MANTSSADASSADMSKKPPPIKALVLDFDSTISTPTFLKRVNSWAIADNVALFTSMTEEEVVANFGGAARIATLEALFSALEAAGVRLHIISIGYKASYVPHLAKVGLLKFFGGQDSPRLWGQDSPELRGLGFVKGRLIAQVMAAQGWAAGDVLFVDDSNEHIERAASVCRTLLVTSKATAGGMAAPEFEAIRAAAGLPAAAGKS